MRASLEDELPAFLFVLVPLASFLSFRAPTNSLDGLRRPEARMRCPEGLTG
jgi:hypothetical protein